MSIRKILRSSYMKRILVLVVVLALSFLVSQSLYAAPKETAPAPSKEAAPAPGKEAAPISGKVVETMDSGGYTYALVEKSKTKTWVAVPKMKLKKGQEVSFQPGMEMENFKSKTLDRTFDKIIFSAGPVNPAK
jgi:hypothetical protein